LHESLVPVFAGFDISVNLDVGLPYFFNLVRICLEEFRGRLVIHKSLDGLALKVGLRDIAYQDLQ